MGFRVVEGLTRRAGVVGRGHSRWRAVQCCSAEDRVVVGHSSAGVSPVGVAVAVAVAALLRWWEEVEQRRGSKVSWG